MKRVLIVLFVLLVVGGVLAYSKIRSLYAKVYRGTQEVVPTRKEENIMTILLMGYGGGRHEGTYLTDSMMVARIDIKTNDISLISLPRDMWVRVPT